MGRRSGRVNTNFVRFSAAIDIQTDAAFKEFEDFSIGYFSPESVCIDAKEQEKAD